MSPVGREGNQRTSPPRRARRRPRAQYSGTTHPHRGCRLQQQSDSIHPRRANPSQPRRRGWFTGMRAQLVRPGQMVVVRRGGRCRWSVASADATRTPVVGARGASGVGAGGAWRGRRGWCVGVYARLVRRAQVRLVHRVVGAGGASGGRRGWFASPGCVSVLVGAMCVKVAFGVPFGIEQARHLTHTTPTREGRSYPGAADRCGDKDDDGGDGVGRGRPGRKGSPKRVPARPLTGCATTGPLEGVTGRTTRYRVPRIDGSAVHADRTRPNPPGNGLPRSMRGTPVVGRGRHGRILIPDRGRNHPEHGNPRPASTVCTGMMSIPRAADHPAGA